MERDPAHSINRLHLYVPAIYFVVSITYIVLSTMIFGELYGYPDDIFAVEALKGAGFVALSTVLISVLLYGHHRRHRSSETKFFGLVESLHDTVMLVRLSDRVVTYANPAAGGMFGYDMAELVGASTEKLHENKAQFDRLGAESSAAHAAGRAYRLEFDLRRRNGEVFPARMTLSTFTDDAGVAYSVCVIRDISEQKRQEAALRESEARFRQIAENLNDVFWISDPDTTRIEYVSPAYETIWGRPVEELYRNPRSFMDAIHPEDRDWVAERISGKTAGDYEAEYRIRRPDGETRWISDRGVAIRDGNGEVYRVVGVAEDITERKGLELQLRQAIKMEAVGQLTGGIAHDFNNLLTVIIGNLELIQSQVHGDKLHEKQIGMALDAAQRGAELTRRLLSFSRRQVLEPKIADINALIDGMANLIQRTLGASISFETKLADRLPATLIDATHFESALLNLAVNARDAMPDGGKLVVETRQSRLNEHYAALVPDLAPGDYVVVSVSDTGCGIPADTIDRVFDPFFSTKNTGKGSGLGLSMVYGFIKQSKGHVTVYSEVGLGTTFRLYLPQSADDIDQESIGKPISETVKGGAETVLIVEDEEPVRATLALILEELGYTVVAASDGPSAIETLRGEIHIDLLLSDIVMPNGMNGRAVANAALEIRPGLKVLLTSGYPQETISYNGVLDEGINFIGKPYQSEELARKIRDVLDG
ncbi:MAG: PAS domain S-box protein [Alphaproteobacteria bacterium]